MAKVLEIDWHPDARTLRQFGWIALGGFTLLAVLAWQEWLVFAFGLGAARPWVCAAFLALGVLAGATSLIHPPANRPLYVSLTVLAYPIGLVLSFVLLGLLFYGIITPIGLALRASGRDSMARALRTDADSYFVKADAAPPEERYFKQF